MLLSKTSTLFRETQHSALENDEACISLSWWGCHLNYLINVGGQLLQSWIENYEVLHVFALKAPYFLPRGKGRHAFLLNLRAVAISDDMTKRSERMFIQLNT